MKFSPRTGLFLILCSLGCAAKAPPDGRVDVNGTVNWNGAPVPAGTLMVYSPEGAIDAAEIHNGLFHLRTKPGQKTVSVMAEREIGTPPPTERIPHPAPVKFQYLPPECNRDSKFKEQITEQTHELKIDMTGKDLEPPKDALKAPAD